MMPLTPMLPAPVIISTPDGGTIEGTAASYTRSGALVCRTSSGPVVADPDDVVIGFV